MKYIFNLAPVPFTKLEEIRGEHEVMMGPFYYMTIGINFVIVLCFRNKIHRLNCYVSPKFRFVLNLTGYIDTIPFTSSVLKPLVCFIHALKSPSIAL
jgi:hypothetical protein